MHPSIARGRATLERVRNIEQKFAADRGSTVRYSASLGRLILLRRGARGECLKFLLRGPRIAVGQKIIVGSKRVGPRVLVQERHQNGLSRT